MNLNNRIADLESRAARITREEAPPSPLPDDEEVNRLHSELCAELEKNGIDIYKMNQRERGIAIVMNPVTAKLASDLARRLGQLRDIERKRQRDILTGNAGKDEHHGR